MRVSYYCVIALTTSNKAESKIILFDGISNSTYYREQSPGRVTVLKSPLKEWQKY